MTDDPNRRAIAAIVRTFKQASAEHADLEYTARQVLVALQGLGWRPTNARPQPWQHQAGTPAPPTSDYLAARPR